MTPQPPNAAPAKPAALPLVALILGVLGFCIVPLFPVAMVLAIVSLVKSSEPAYAARKTLSIITLVLGLVYVPVVGILAAIAIPNFIRYQARAKQSECKANLKSLWFAQQAHFSEHDAWATTAEELHWAPEPRTRYAYRIGPDSVVPASAASTLSTPALEGGYPPGLMDLVGSHGQCPDACVLTMVCAGNVDSDPTVDVWSVSSQQRAIDGEVVPPGSLFHEVDDLTD